MKLRRLFGQRWLSALTLLAFVFLILAPASALPEGPTVVHGNVKVMTAGQLQQILQSSSQGIINWSSFGIGPNEIVRIIQPNSSSVLLNRVTGMDPSVLQGLLQANGRIFLVNPNGILFGPNSKVDAGSFFASTLGISDQDFLKGNYNFSQNPQGQLAAIVNQGEIRVGDGGFIVLAAPLVHNDGLIVARQGSVNLAATQHATLQLDPQGSWQVVVPDGFEPTFSNPVKNGEAVLLQRGQVTDILSSVVKGGAILEATSFEDTGSALVAKNASGLALNSGRIVVDGNPGQAAGRIRIDSERASVQAPTGVLSAVGDNAAAGDIRVVSNGASITAGAVDAHATGTGHGGFVELSGQTLNFGQGVQVGSELGYAGTLLLDPQDLVIVPTAGSLDGSLPTIGNATGGPVSHTLSATSLNSITSGNVILNATRDILYQTTTANINLPSAVNLAVTAGRNITFQSTGTTSMLGIQAGNISLNAGQDLTLQGRNGVLINATNGSVEFTSGGNQTIQYVNNNPGSFNPRRVMAINATSGVRLTAGGNLTFATNNLGDVIHGSPNITQVGSNSGPVSISAANDLYLGVAIRTAGNATVTAGQTLVIAPSNISQSEAAPVVGGSLSLQGSSVNVNTDLTVGGPLNIQASNGDVLIGHGAPVITAGNFTVNATQDLNLRSTNPTGILNITTNVVNLQAGRDLAIQGRNGVNITSNTTANLTAGRDLSVQYFNNNPGSFNPRQIMALNATGNVNLTAANNLVFATNNLGDVIQGSPNATFINSETQSIALNAGQNAFVGVRVVTPKNASIVAGGNVDVAPLNILQSQAAPSVQGNLTLSGSNVRVETDLTVNGTLSIQASNDVLIGHGAPVVTAGNFTVNATQDLNLRSTSPTGILNITTNVVNLQAGRDLAIQGRNGVNITSNTTANLTAGRDLSVQYFNNNFATFNPSQIMALNATGNVNLTAANNLVFATNNLGDVIQGSPNATFINSETQSIALNAGQNAFVGVRVVTPKNASIVAAGNVNIAPLNILQSQAAPSVQGNLTISGSSVNVETDLTVNGTLNIQASNGDVLIGHGAPVITAGNFTVNATQDLNLRSTSPTGILNITTNVVNLQAGRDLAIQGRNGVNMTANTTADLTAGRDLSVQYFNNNFATFNPRQIMALNATGNVNLTAANNLVFATNNLGDVIQGSPNATFINSETQSIALNAGQNAFVGVRVVTPKNASIVAAGNVNIAPLNILQSQAAPSVQGNLTISGSNVRVETDLTVNGTLNIQASNGDVFIGHGAPVITAGNFTVNATQDLNLRSTSPQGVLNITTNVVNLQAGRDLAIQGRNGVNITANTTADLTAGRDLSVQYFNNNLGTFNPRQIMALNATGNVNLTAANNLVFATNNLGDAINGSPNATFITSQSGSIAVNAGQDLFLGVSTNSTLNDTLIAGGTLSVGNLSINGLQATTNTTGNLSIAANALNISAATPLSAQGALTLNISSGINLTSDLNSAQGLTLISNNSISGNGRNVTSSNGVVNLTVFGNGNLTFNNSNISGNNGVALQNLGNGTASVTASNLVSSQGIAAISTGNGGLTIDRSSLNSTSGNVSLRNSGAGPVQLSNSAVTATNVDILNSGSGTLSVSNSSFTVSNILTAQNQGGGRLNFTGSNVVAGQSVSLTSNGGNTQVDNSTFNTTTLALLNSGTSNFSSQGSKFLANTSVTVQNQGSGALNLSAANINAAQGVVLNSTSTGASFVTGSNVRGQSINVTSNAGPWGFSSSNLNSVGALSIASQGSGVNVIDTNITSSNGPLGIKSAANSSVVLGNSTRVTSINGSVTIDSGGNLLAGPQSSVRAANVTLKAPGTITVGILNASNAVINSTGGNIILESMSNLSGGNFSLYTPLALLENTPVSPTANLSALPSLTLDVGNIFGNATLTSPFSVVNSSTIDILITAPNDPSRGKAAELRTLGGAIPVVRRGPNAGAIFLDGVELFVTPALQPILRITRREDLDDRQQVELIQQLAQCNLGLGNKSGTAYFVQSEDRMQVPYNSEGLSGSYFDFPMAITLEHIAELDPKSILEKAKLDQGVARATNVMNAQEQQEAWEIRYWSNFIERIILWGDDQ